MVSLVYRRCKNSLAGITTLVGDKTENKQTTEKQWAKKGCKWKLSDSNIFRSPEGHFKDENMGQRWKNMP